MPTWLVVQHSKDVLLLTLYDSINYMKYFQKLSPSHLSPATAIFVVDCCQFGPSWDFGLKLELMVCADLVGGTTEQSFIFTGLN